MMGDCANCGHTLDDAVLGVNGLLFCDDECLGAYENAVEWEAWP